MGRKILLTRDADQKLNSTRQRSKLKYVRVANILLHMCMRSLGKRSGSVALLS